MSKEAPKYHSFGFLFFFSLSSFFFFPPLRGFLFFYLSFFFFLNFKSFLLNTTELSLLFTRRFYPSSHPFPSFYLVYEGIFQKR